MSSMRRQRVNHGEFECRLKQFRQLKELDTGAAGGKGRGAQGDDHGLEKAQYNPSLKLAVDISRAVGAPIEEIFIFD